MPGPHRRAPEPRTGAPHGAFGRGSVGLCRSRYRSRDALSKSSTDLVSTKASGDSVTVTVPSFRIDIETDPGPLRRNHPARGLRRHTVGVAHPPDDTGATQSQLGAGGPGPDGCGCGGPDRGHELEFHRSRDRRVGEFAADVSRRYPGLDNPLAQTQGVMRRSLLPGMLTATNTNINQGERTLAFFEQGRAFALADARPSRARAVGGGSDRRERRRRGGFFPSQGCRGVPRPTGRPAAPHLAKRWRPVAEGRRWGGARGRWGDHRRGRCPGARLRGSMGDPPGGGGGRARPRTGGGFLHCRNSRPWRGSRR